MKIRSKRLFSAGEGFLAAVSALTLMMVGCAKEPVESPENGGTAAPLRFDVSVDNGWNKAPESRSAAAGEPSEAAKELGIAIGSTYKGEEVIGVYKLQDEQSEAADGQQFYLIATTSDWEVDSARAEALTRAAAGSHELVTGKDNFYDKFAVYSYWYDGEWNDTNSHPMGLVNEFINTSNPVVQEGIDPNKAEWRKTEHARFFAYAPVDKHIKSISSSYPNFDITDNYMVPSLQSDPGVPYLDCIFASATEYTEDLLYAETTVRGDGKDSRNGVNLSFHHALAAVALVGGEGQEVDGYKYVTPQGRIGYFSLSNVKMQGRFYLDGRWSNVDFKEYNADGAYSAEYRIGTSTASGEVGQQITPDNGIMMLIPQTLESTRLTIILKDAALPSEIAYQSRTLSATIPSLQLIAGQKVKLHISVPELVSRDVVSVSCYNYGQLGGPANTIRLGYGATTPNDDSTYSSGFKVSAARVYGDRYNANRWTVQNVSWTITVYDQAGQKLDKLPEWVLVTDKLTELKNSGTLSGTGDFGRVSLGATAYDGSHAPFILRFAFYGTETTVQDITVSQRVSEVDI